MLTPWRGVSAGQAKCCRRAGGRGQVAAGPVRVSNYSLTRAPNLTPMTRHPSYVLIRRQAFYNALSKTLLPPAGKPYEKNVGAVGRRGLRVGALFRGRSAGARAAARRG